MSAGVAFLVAFLVVHGVGASAILLFPTRPRSAIAVFGATGVAGAAFIAFEMLLSAVAGISWSIPRLLILPGLLALLAIAPRARTRIRRMAPTRIDVWLASAAGLLLLATYAVGTARATSPDLVLFWGAKAERFALARGIDVPFLARPANFLMHPDYPPLLPFLGAFAAMFAGRFAWGASLLMMPWFLAIAAAIFYTAAVRRLGNASAAAALTAVLIGALGLANLVSATAGGADALLVGFEVAALASLTAIGSRALREWTASLALAAAALTKIEGIFFAAIVLLMTFLTTKDRWRNRATTACRLALAPAMAFGTWILFCRRHGLVAMYRAGVFGAPTLRFLPRILSVMARSASYDYAYLPWLTLAASAFALRRFGFAAAPGGAAIFVLATDVGFYLHGNTDPSIWVGWSAARTLMGVLVCGFLSIGRPVPAAERLTGAG